MSIRKPEKFEQAVALFEQGLSIRKVEKRVGIAHNTARGYYWEWRSRRTADAKQKTPASGSSDEVSAEGEAAGG